MTSFVTTTEEITKNLSCQPTQLYDHTDDHTPDTIVSFLSRPQLILSGLVSSASAVNATLTNLGTNSFLVVPNVFSSKLAGVYGFSGTLVVRLETSAQQFQAGILMQSYVPMAASMNPIRTQIARSRLSLRRQLPSVVHNISSHNESIIKIPYVSDENFFRFGKSEEWFTYSLSVYSAIQPSGSVPYTIWAHWEDVKLISAVSQSRGVDPTSQERPTGIISRPLKTFSEAFDQLGNIPMLSSIAQTTSWFFAASSKAASAFGFSNPNSIDHRHAITMKSSSHANNCDVMDNCDSHALCLSNSIGHLDKFAGNPLDEMSVSYISQIPFVGLSLAWATTQPTGTLLTSWLCNTRGMYDSYTVATTTPTSVFVLAPSSYLLEGSTLWRGSLCYRINFAKTMFHTGRIAIVFNPDHTVSTSFAQIGNLHKMIVDLRDNYVVEFIVPFISNKLFLPTTTNDQSFGSISIFVLDQLNAPPTVSTTVQMTFEMSAGPDFEFAGETSSINLTPIYAQSGMVVPSVYTDSRICTEAFNLTGGPLKTDLKPALFATGESVLSIRQLLKRSKLFFNSNFTTGVTRGFVFQTDPYAILLPQATTGAAAAVFPPSTIPLDTFSRLAPLFALQRGGMILRSGVTTQTGTVATLSSLRHNTSGFSTQTSVASTSVVQGFYPNLIYGNNNTQGMMEVHIPYYQSTHSIPIVNTQTPWLAPSANSQYINYAYELYSFQPIAATTTNVMVFRQIADDFSFGLFIGTLPVTAEPSLFVSM